MKTQKHTLGILNLVFFLTSFLLVSFAGFSNTTTNYDPGIKRSSVAAKDQSNQATSQLLSEENENENELDHASPQFTVTFYNVSIIALSAFIFLLYKDQTHIYEGTPVYIAVRSFRI